MQIDNRVSPPTISYYQQARDAFAGDPMAELAVLVVDHARSARQVQRTEARAQEAQLRLVQDAQIRAMHAEAEKIKLAGMHEGAWMIGGGLATIGAGLAHASSGTSEPPASSTLLAGAGKGSEGVGKMLASHYQYQASEARERATVAEHQAQEAERRLADSRDARSQTRDLEKSAFEHLRNIQNTRAEIDRTLTNWRA